MTKKEIKKILEKMADAFAMKDTKKYLNLFARESDVIIYGSQTGEKWTDIKEFKKSVERDWDLADSIKLHYDWMEINAKGDIGWLATDIRFETKVGDQTMMIPGRMTAVIIKEKKDWKIAQSHFSMEMPAPK